jgi:hypothetical protein
VGDWWLFTVMPAYRFLLFCFRFVGFISAMNEPSQWKTASPWSMAKTHAGHVGVSIVAQGTPARMGPPEAWSRGHG